MKTYNLHEGAAVNGPQLVDQVRAYILFRNLTKPGEYRLTRAVAVFGEFLGRSPTVADLADARVSEWIRWMQERYAQKTVVGFRGDLLTLWRDCASRSLCPPPHRVCRVRKPEPLPVSWTAAELRMLIAYVQSIEGKFPTGVSRAQYCEALVRAIYDTGLRRSDIWLLTRAQVRPDGSVVLRQHKTGGTHCPLMRPETLRQFQELPGERPLACPFRSPSNFYQFWKRVTESAGVRHGALQQLRRTGATHLAIEHRDSVQRYLGHRTPEMQRHYLDESIATPQRFMPPPITGPE